jgi:hypothetical protein
VLFLAAPDAGYLTGQTLSINRRATHGVRRRARCAITRDRELNE